MRVEKVERIFRNKKKENKEFFSKPYTKQDENKKFREVLQKYQIQHQENRKEENRLIKQKILGERNE